MTVSLILCTFTILCKLENGCNQEDPPFVVTVRYDEQVSIAELSYNADQVPIPVLNLGSAPTFLDFDMRFAGGGGVFPSILLTINPVSKAGILSLHSSMFGFVSSVGTCEIGLE